MVARMQGIEHCKQCCYSWHDDVSGVWFCGQRLNAPARKIHMLDGIPDWCPLLKADKEDADEAE